MSESPALVPPPVPAGAQTGDAHSADAPGSAMARALLSGSRRSTVVLRGDIAALHNGDPDLATPEHIRRALSEAVEAGATHYAPPLGDPELRAALAETLSRNGGRPVSSAQVMVTHGASGGLGAIFLATLNAGDRVVIPTPTYSLYADHVRMAGAVPEFVPCRPDLHLDLQAVERACRGARMLVLCHPCNPTGVVLRPDEMESVGRIAADNDLLVVSDEAYDAIVFDGRPFVSALRVEALQDRLLYCNTLSKRYSMTGWRVGYVASPASLAPAVGRLHATLHGPLNTAVQRAALAAITGPQDCVDRLATDCARRRDLAMTRLAGIPGVRTLTPEGTFYLFVGYPQPILATEMQGRAHAGGVAVRAGSEFGDAGEGHLRVSTTAVPEVLEQGLERLAAVLARA